MSFDSSALFRLGRRTQRKSQSRSRVSRLRIESLEQRCVLSANPLAPELGGVDPMAGPEAGDTVAGELLIGFKAGASEQAITGLYKTHGLSELERLYRSDQVRRVAVPEQASDIVSKALANNPLVEYAEPNYVASTLLTPNDPYYSYQWHLTNSEFGGIHVEQAWDVTGGAGAIVAVLDTGVAYENYSDSLGSYYVAPDLAETLFVPGYDFINGDAHANDDHSHGTHVSGTIAQSTNNARGVSGVGFDASVMPVKVLGANGSGSYSAIANGIRWSADNGANVINMSLGASSPSQTLEDALAYAYGKGVTIVAAAGNDGQNAVSYPAAYDDYVIAVSATRYDEQLAPYSNYGSSIDLAAPGGDTSVDQNGDGYVDGVLQNTFNPLTKNTSDFGYYFFQGTSMAAPHVAGVAALIVSQGITDPAQVRNILQSSAEDKGAEGVDDFYGHGIVDAAAAMAALTGSNAAPVAGNDEASTDEDVTVVIDVLANDTDTDGDTLSVASVTQPTHGSVVINADETVSYTPVADYHGSDSFTYTVTDGHGGTDTATVDVTVNSVNDAPLAVDDSASTEVNTAVSIAVLANDTDVDGDTLSLSAFDATSANAGTVTDNGDGTLTYTPAADFTGTDSFDYTVSDGNGGSDSAVVTVEVQEANSLHVGDLDGSPRVKGKSGKWDASVTAIIHDVNDQPVSGVTVSGTWSGATEGSVSGTTDADGSVTFTTGNIDGGSSVTFAVDDVSGDAVYEPSSNHDPDGDSDGSSITINKDGSSSAGVTAFARSETTEAELNVTGQSRDEEVPGEPNARSIESPTLAGPSQTSSASTRIESGGVDPTLAQFSTEDDGSPVEATLDYAIDGLVAALADDGVL